MSFIHIPGDFEGAELDNTIETKEESGRGEANTCLSKAIMNRGGGGGGGKSLKKSGLLGLWLDWLLH